MNKGEKWAILAALQLVNRALKLKGYLPPKARSAIKDAHFELTRAKQEI